jgi:hypothetical protein
MNNRIDLNELRQTKEFIRENNPGISTQFTPFTNKELSDLVKKYPNDAELGKFFRIEFLKRKNK